MYRKRRLYWRLTCLAVVALSVLIFTPLVTPSGRYQPMLAGVPYTLWVGILVTIGFVALTYVGTRLYPVEEPGEEEAA